VFLEKVWEKVEFKGVLENEGFCGWWLVKKKEKVVNIVKEVYNENVEDERNVD
jgi:hypothetical protein